MRDHRKLIAFARARELASRVYRATSAFPREEQFGLPAQLRRASVSIPSNLVEGCGRRSERDYARFVDMALGSARELEFQLDHAEELGFLGENGDLIGLSQEVARLVAGLANAFADSPRAGRQPQMDRDTRPHSLRTES